MIYVFYINELLSKCQLNNCVIIFYGHMCNDLMKNWEKNWKKKSKKKNFEKKNFEKKNFEKKKFRIFFFLF